MAYRNALVLACVLAGCGGGEANLSEEGPDGGAPAATSIERLTEAERAAEAEAPGDASALTFGAITPQAMRQITFDEVPAKTVINTHYSGVTFSKLLKGVEGGDVVVNNTDPVRLNTVGFKGLPMFDNRSGTMHVTFASPRTSVSIDVRLILAPEGMGKTGIGYMKVYDSAKNLVGTAQTSKLGTWQTLSLSAPEIKHAYFTVQYVSYPTYGIFDKLVFSGP